MSYQILFRPQTLTKRLFTARLLTTAVVGILALIGGFALANGPAARAAMEKAGLLQAAVPTIPETFNYQGFLREADGSPTTGVKNITSKIYAAPAGGTAIHTESFANVNVRDGLFNIVIGDATPLGATFDQAPLYIGISVDGTELIPRERIHGVPWAIRATTAGSATTADSATTAETATTAGSATTATTANAIAPSAMSVAVYQATNGALTILPFPIPNSGTHICFLTGVKSFGQGNPPVINDCQISSTPELGAFLVAGPDSLCQAGCMQWGQ